MNPELIRNLWLELTPKRLLAMPLVLGAVLFSILTTTDYDIAAVERSFQLILGGILGIWGTWMTAHAVVGEIRERTWDGQKLSALAPWTLALGKLFGAPAFAWYGGLICMAVLLVVTSLATSPFEAVLDLLMYLSLGVFSHAVALGASILGVRKAAPTGARLNTIFYAAAGVAAGWGAYVMWGAARYSEWSDHITWFGAPIAGPIFILGSLAAFCGWAVIGVYRLMRLELMLTNRPFVWLGFVAFVGTYAAGFAWPGVGEELKVSAPLMAAALALAGLTYAAVFFEPKDPVTLRRLWGQVRSGDVGAVAVGLNGWMYAYLATGLLALATMLTFDLPPLVEWAQTEFEAELVDVGRARAWFLAAFLFLTRDCLIFLYFNLLPGRRRGDFAALVTLFLLWVVLPSIVGVTQAESLWLVVPWIAASPMLMIAAPLVHAGIAASLVAIRLGATVPHGSSDKRQKA